MKRGIFLILAHRGASGYAPENTFAAFDKAVELGADMIETDVRQSKDGHLVLFHDPSVERTTDGHGLIADLALAKLKALDAGSWFAPEFAGQRIPTAEEFLANYSGCISLCFDIKSQGVEEKLLELVRRYGALADSCFTSFHRESIQRVKRLAPKAKIGLLAGDFSEELTNEVVALRAEQICPPAAKLSPELVTSAHEQGLEVRVWGVDTDELAERAILAGADGMTTEWPDKVRQRLLWISKDTTRRSKESGRPSRPGIPSGCR